MPGVRFVQKQGDRRSFSRRCGDVSDVLSDRWLCQTAWRRQDGVGLRYRRRELQL
jgi:hypothetical protein